MTFFDKDEIMALHQANVERFGGSLGIRDEGALLSAIEAPKNRAFYDDADEIACSAAYGFHLCQAHAFVDGNKRIAAVACELFLRDNGIYLNWTNEEVIETFLAIASSKMTREELEAFLRWHVV
ncbi:MAG TPA: type II toxin-antitoxin system death-on-curing family toxin [Abditibacterium sp.]|jgi:death-on-curing protein